MVRGRRVNSSGEKSKQLLLEKAIELFSEHGYHQTKISDIVKAANLTQPTFYLYFHSKEILFQDLNEKFRSSLLEIFSHSVSDTKGEMYNCRQFIEQKLCNIFNYFLENPSLTKIGFYESVEASEVKNTFVTLLVNILKNAEQQFTVLQSVDAKILAESLLGSIERLTLTELLTKKQTPEQLAQNIVNIYFIEQVAYSK